MLKKPTDEQLQALHRLHGNDNFETVCAWLNESLEEARVRIETEENEIRLRQTQGACQALSKFLEVKVKAFELLKARRGGRGNETSAFV